MTDLSQRRPEDLLPPSIAKILTRFSKLGREEKMQALVSLSKKLPPLPERFLVINGPDFEVPECQKPLRLFPEFADGRMHYHAQIDPRQSPTVSAFLALLLGALNDQPPETTLAIPADFVRTVMQSVGLGTREVGLEAIVARLKRFASDAIAARAS
jgi:cysteine desulfuration protein SufE